MNKTDQKIKILFVMIAVILAVNIKIAVSYYKDVEKIENKTEWLAQELDKLSLEVSNLYSGKESSSGSDTVSQKDVVLMMRLQNRLKEMKKEIDDLKNKNGENPALSEYREKEERLWKSRADKVKEVWTANLDQNLAASGFSDTEREMITEDYAFMLDKMRDEQLRWYNGEITSEDLNDISQNLSREFFDNMSYSVGEQKALTVMGILFPDPVVRKNLLED